MNVRADERTTCGGPDEGFADGRDFTAFVSDGCTRKTTECQSIRIKNQGFPIRQRSGRQPQRSVGAAVSRKSLNHFIRTGRAGESIRFSFEYKAHTQDVSHGFFQRRVGLEMRIGIDICVYL